MKDGPCHLETQRRHCSWTTLTLSRLPTPDSRVQTTHTIPNPNFGRMPDYSFTCHRV